MQTYVILRRSGWETGGDLEQAAARSTIEGDNMPEDIRWIRSYVLDETDGRNSGMGTGARVWGPCEQSDVGGQRDG